MSAIRSGHHVLVAGDNVSRLAAVRAMLEQQFTVSTELLASMEVPGHEIDAVIVAADLRLVENISALKRVAGELTRIRKRVFLIDRKNRLCVVQAHALGATHVLANPVSKPLLLAKLVDQTFPEFAPADVLSGGQAAAQAGAASIASMFLAVSTGAEIDAKDAKDAARKIADSVAEDGLFDWITTVRLHHEGTYQHCLLVTGVAVDFGLSLGLGKFDLERLYSAAMFHDIGKAKIPRAVLDKPGRLEAEERLLIETHPAAGWEALNGNPNVSPEILDAVRHHHEYLDGSGYPDALAAESISDIVRILTISDIFAALIEHRTYKPTMPREQAYEIIRGMHGKLEVPLVAAFREVALNR